MKYLKKFATQSDYETYMSGQNEETIFPNVSIVIGGEAKFHNLLPNVDTTGYATTFEHGKRYPKEAMLFKTIVSDFIETSDLENGDPSIWMDLSNGSVDVQCFQHTQTFSIADQPLFINYLSKITNFCDEDGNPSSTLNIFPDCVTRDEYVLGSSSFSLMSNLDFKTGLFTEVKTNI